MATDEMEAATKKDLRDVASDEQADKSEDTSRTEADAKQATGGKTARKIRRVRGKVRTAKGKAKARKLRRKRKVRRVKSKVKEKTAPAREAGKEVKLLASELGISNEQARKVRDGASEALAKAEDVSAFDTDGDGDTDILENIEQGLDAGDGSGEFSSPVPNDEVSGEGGVVDESFLNGLDPATDFEDDLDVVGGDEGSIEDQLGL